MRAAPDSALRGVSSRRCSAFVPRHEECERRLQVLRVERRAEQRTMRGGGARRARIARVRIDRRRCHCRQGQRAAGLAGRAERQLPHRAGALGRVKNIAARKPFHRSPRQALLRRDVIAIAAGGALSPRRRWRWRLSCRRRRPCARTSPRPKQRRLRASTRWAEGRGPQAAVSAGAGSGF